METQEKSKRCNIEYADTYIEGRFVYLCNMNRAEKVLKCWWEDKQHYISRTEISGFDFQHYSLHDKSHSISILHSIEKVLGRDRVDMLEAGDLWLLLESAYSHDIGMAVEYKELVEIWESEDFEKYVRECLIAESDDLAKASQFYDMLNDLVHDRKRMEDAEKTYDVEENTEEFEGIIERKSWPIICERYIMMLYTDYIRRHHAERSKKDIVKFATQEDREIPSRMYKVVANIAWLHGQDFQEIFENADLHEEGFPFDEKTMHPQFAAAMLRLGDLLDMDNNRFNIRMLKHMGILPAESMLHLKKHKAIEHLAYSENGIEATARSGEFDVCLTTSQWFRLLDQEVNQLICCWNQIAPRRLYGCRLNRCKLKIYFKGELFDISGQSKMTVDPARIFKLLIGENIYKTRLDFIREYLQNAMDASRMALWLWLIEQRGDDEIYALAESGELTPFHVEPALYEQFKIEVAVNIDWQEQKVLFSIQDHGIGMEKECVIGLSNVAGDNWKRRKSFAAEIGKMPLWLRPTGGFGIGVQSAFMITDFVQFSTKTANEAMGRSVRLDSIRKGGNMSVYNSKDIKNGTKVELRIGLVKFLGEFFALLNNERYFFEEIVDKDFEPVNIYDRNEIAAFIQKLLVDYISMNAGNSFFPIHVRCDDEHEETVGMDWGQFWKGKEFGNPWSVRKKLLTAGEESDVGYTFVNSEEGSKTPEWILWNYTDHKMVLYRMTQGGKAEDRCYFKNITIYDEAQHTDAPFAIDITYFFKDVAKNLSVSRDHLLPKGREEYKSDLVKYRCQCAGILAENITKMEVGNQRDILAKQILIWESLKVIRLSTKIYNKVLDVVGNHRIEVMCLRKDILDSYEQVKAEVKKSLSKVSELNEGELDEFVLRTLVMKTTTLEIKQYLDYLRKENDVLYVRQGNETPENYVIVSRFLQRLTKLRENGAAEGEDYEPKDVIESICWNLLQEQKYVNVDPYVVPVLADYYHNLCKNNTLEWIRIEQNDRVTMDIYHFFKSVKKAKNNQTVAKVIKRQLSSGLSANAFPVVLKGIVEDEEKKEDSETEGLWVGQVFHSAASIPMFDEKKIVAGTVRYKYLIVPMTEAIWFALEKEFKQRSLTRAKYNGMMKAEDEWRLLEAWIYKYQISESRKTLDEIKKSLDKMIDWMYDWLFG